MKQLIFVTTIGLCSVFAQAGEKVDRTLDADADGYVEIEHVDGSAKVTGWDKNQVRVVGELGDKTEEFIFKRSGKRVRIEVEVERRNGKWGWNNGGDGDNLEIFVPHQSVIKYSSTNADVEVKEIFGGASIETVNGKIDVEDLAGRIKLEAVNGDIHADGLKADKLNIETVNGDIRDASSESERANYETVNGSIDAHSTSTDVRAETVNGSIELRLAKVNDVNLDTVNGSIEASMALEKNGSVRASSVGGAIDLMFDEDVSAHFDLQGHAGGRIRNNLSDDEPQKAKYGPSRWLTFSLNGGAGRVDVSTVNGRLTLAAKEMSFK